MDFFIPERPEGDSLGMLLWLVLPMLAVVLIILFQKISWTELGFIPNFKGNGKWYVASFLIFPIVTGIVLLVGVAAKWIDASALNPRSFILVFAGSLISVANSDDWKLDRRRVGMRWTRWSKTRRPGAC